MKQLLIGIVIAFVFVGLPTWNYITGLKADIVSLTATVNDLTVTVEQKNFEIDILTGQNTQLSNELAASNAKVASYAAQVSNLESKAAGLQTQVSNLQTNLTSLQSEKTALNTRIGNILKTTVIQHYDWLNAYTWELPIPLSLYFEYKERPRQTTTSAYVSMATDPKDDDYLDQMVQFVNDKAQQYHFTEQQKIDFVVAFVQSLPYTVDSVTTSADEYPRYPIETLFDRGGDCEDTAILTAALLDKMGYDVALLHLADVHHMATGISMSTLALPYQYWYYDYNGKKYYYIETTGEGWRIGQMPSEYTSVSAHVYPLKK